MQRTSFLPLIIALSALLAVSCTKPSATSSEAQKEKTQAFVMKALKYAKKNGTKAALKAFSSKKGPFFKGEHYIFAYDYKGINLAHPTMPHFIGKNKLLIKDIRGNYPIKLLIKKAKRGGGWVSSSFHHPIRNKIEPKAMYVTPVIINGKKQGWFIGSGYYPTKQ